MSYKDGITINGKHSFDDFGLCIAERNIGIPVKKVIKKTIPYMNGAYDFTMLNGVPAYEERQITYGFDIIGVTVEEMEAEKASVLAWLYLAQEVDIFDDAYPDTHFHGSCNDIDWDEDDSQGHLTVTFNVYPFRLANVESVRVFDSAEATINVTNDGAPVKVKINSPQSVTAMLDEVSYTFGSGEYIYPALLPSGVSSITVKHEQLLPYSGYEDSKKDANIDYTVDKEKGTVLASGISDAISWFEFGSFKVKPGRYRCTGAPVGSPHNRIQYTVTPAIGERYVVTDEGAGCELNITGGNATVLAAIRIGTGKILSDQAYAPRVYQITTVWWSAEVL